MGESFDCMKALGREGEYNPQYQQFMKQHVPMVQPRDTHMADEGLSKSEFEKEFWKAVWKMQEENRKKEERRNFFR